jgi:hypothetical protein
MGTKTIRRDVQTAQRGIVHYNLVKAGLGTPTLDGADSLQFSVTDNGVGDYTLNLLDQASEENLIAHVSTVTAGVICRVNVVDKSSVRVLCFSDLAETTPAEGNFHALIIAKSRVDKY